MADLLETILDVFASHLQQNAGLRIVGGFGNRFEGWFQWECVVALEQAKARGLLPQIGEVALEAEHDYDLLLHGVAGGPDVRLELKARSTKGQGPSELATAMIYDQGKLSAAVRAYGGRAGSLALVIAAPGGVIDRWVSEILAHPWLTKARGSAPVAQTRKIMFAGAPVAALLLFPI
jgi:hypothetical protein